MGLGRWIFALLSASWLFAAPANAADASIPMGKTRQMWMRGGILLAEPKPLSGWLVPDPVLVEVSDDNRVRLADEKGQSLTGWCPDVYDVRKIGMRNVFPALGLYAQASGPVKLSVDGPTVGQVSAGAFVAIRSTRPGWTEIELPFVARGADRYDRHDQKNEQFFVASALLGLERKTMTTEESEGWVPGHGRVLRLEADSSSPIVACTWCLPGKVIRRRQVGDKTAELVRYHLDGVSIEGWADRPLIDDDQDHDCARYVDDRFIKFDLRDGEPTAGRRPTPPGFIDNRFVPDGERLPKVLTDAARYHKKLFIPVIRNARLECAGYRIKDRLTTLAAAPPPDPDLLALEYGLHATAQSLSLLGPTSTVRKGKGLSITAGCINMFRFVGTDSGSLEMIPAGTPVKSYHPDDVEIWYADKGTCTRRATFNQVSTACR